jgi:hypothetical protein
MMLGMSARWMVVLGVLFLSLSACGLSPEGRQQGSPSGTMSSIVGVVSRLQDNPAPVTGRAPLTGNPRFAVDSSPMSYKGGHIAANPLNLYYIFYGDWSQETPTFNLLVTFAQNIGTSQYYAINNPYTNSCNQNVVRSVNFAAMFFDGGSQGNHITDTRQIVSNAMTSPAFPADPNGLYFVLAAPNVTEGSFCSVYCGYHGFMDVNGVRIQYSFVGNPRTQCPMGCADSGVTFPNELGADAMANVMAHELAETATDGWLDAWRDADGNETGDKCNFMFGNTYTTANGGSANTNLGGKDFLLQTLWLPGVNGMCTNALTPGTATCTDGVLNGEETDVDCGGFCPACAQGQHCAVSSDCAYSWCNAGVCSPANCTNGVKDGIETDVDCGELCPGCAVGRACTYDSDCQSKVCAGGTCADHCHNGVKDVDESDVDCGGSCGGCADGKQCGTLFDCASQGCNRTTHICVEHCADGVKNYLESDVDCGGVCPACANGKRCKSSTDCQAGVCLLGECFAYCQDHMLDQAESDVDCGGGSCPSCAAGSVCRVATDCASGQCTNAKCTCASDADCATGATCSSGVCSDHCSDGRKDFDETDVDCGGSCAPCGPGLHCKKGVDCSTTVCRSGSCGCTYASNCPSVDACLLGICYPHCKDNQKDADETDVDCGGVDCPACAPGLHCKKGTDCTTTVCRSGSCGCTYASNCPSTDLCLLGICWPHCKDNQQDVDETGVDCGGADCPLCPLCSSP